ncbi:MAG: PAS domain-containing protein [Coprococcus sp.]
MNQYKELKDSFLLLKAQINALCASNSSSNEENYHELRRATDDFEAFLFHRFVDFEKICDNLPDAIYIADKEGTTVYVNDMYQQLSGILKKKSSEKIFTRSIVRKNFIPTVFCRQS